MATLATTNTDIWSCIAKLLHPVDLTPLRCVNKDLRAIVLDEYRSRKIVWTEQEHQHRQQHNENLRIQLEMYLQDPNPRLEIDLRDVIARGLSFCKWLLLGQDIPIRYQYALTREISKHGTLEMFKWVCPLPSTETVSIPSPMFKWSWRSAVLDEEAGHVEKLEYMCRLVLFQVNTMTTDLRNIQTFNSGIRLSNSGTRRIDSPLHQEHETHDFAERSCRNAFTHLTIGMRSVIDRLLAICEKYNLDAIRRDFEEIRNRI